MVNVKFLELLRTVEGIRACEGLECMTVTDAAMGHAEDSDAAELSKATLCTCGDSLIGSCDCCVTIVGKRNALREFLHSQGVSLPTGMLEP